MKGNMAICEFCIEMRPTADAITVFQIQEDELQIFRHEHRKVLREPGRFCRCRADCGYCGLLSLQKIRVEKVTLMAQRETAIRASASSGSSGMEKWDAAVPATQ